MASSGTRLTTIGNALDVIEVIRDLDGARLTDIARELDMPPSSVYKYVSTLIEEGYLIKMDDEYEVSLKFLEMGIHVRNQKTGFRYGVQVVEELAEETGERVQFVVEENGRGIYLHTEASRSTAVQTNRRVGTSRYLHSSASGKAILAHLPQERVNEIISTQGLPAETEHTITSPEKLFDELEEIRKKGVAFNNEESIEGLRAVGVPIKGSGEAEVIGALSVSGPRYRLNGTLYRDELPELLLGYANELELNVRYD